MFRSYLTVAIRNLLRHKAYSTINVLGLTIGIACSLAILLFVRYELSYDAYHANVDRIYRATLEWHYASSPTGYYGTTSGLLAPTLLQNYPAVEQAVRFHDVQAVNGNDLFIRSEKVSAYEPHGFVADASIFKVFSFPLIQGDSETALKEPFSIVLTEAVSQKYFGDTDPMNQILTVQDTLQFIVTGILAPIPQNSHFTFDFLISFETLNHTQASFMERWMRWPNLGWHTYILLHESASYDEMEAQIQGITQQYGAADEEQFKIRFVHHLQPLKDIYLYSNVIHNIAPQSDIVYIYGSLAIAFLILLIACINFVNLATARAVDRAREVGMRKVVGAYRGQLIAQFLGEALLMTAATICLSVVLIALSLPFLNDLAEQNLTLDIFQNPPLFLSLIGIALGVGVFSGSYPAFVLSSFKPVEVLKGSLKSGQKGIWIRKGLVTFQFIISITLLIVTTAVYTQINYMQSQTLGFDKDHVVVINFKKDPDVLQRYTTIKAEFTKLPNVLTVSTSATVPGRFFNFRNIRVRMSSGEEVLKGIRIQSIDEDYLETLGLTLISGRGFSRDIETDQNTAFLLNEKAVAYFEWGTPEEALGKTFNTRSNRHLIGVVKNFHYVSLHNPIEPYLFYFDPSHFSYFTVKVRSDGLLNTLTKLKKTWAKLIPDKPFDYFFLDEDFAHQYRAEKRQGLIFSIFFGLAIFVGCLGLFGLISFSTQQRTREIGIRKVLGAPISSVVILLSKDFLKPVFLANFIAWPFAYYIINHWLQRFAYRIDVELWPFALGTIAVMSIALSTASFQAWKAACRNPVETLRQE